MLRGVTVIARHGARTPNWAELGPFSEESDVVKQWGVKKLTSESSAEEKAAADDNLSDEGKSQMRELGARFKELSPKTVEWHSSTAKRCVISGQEFWAGFSEELPEIQNSYDRDAAFKMWDKKDCAYKDYVDTLKKGTDKEFVDYAETRADVTKQIWHQLGVTEPSAALRLYWCTYACSLLECEKFANKNALTSKLSKEDQAAIRDMGRWVWERRFQGSKFGDFIGGNLLSLLASWPRNSDGIFLRFMSGHDYSILSALAAAGAGTYDEVLSFGAYLRIDHYDDYDVWKLCTEPFSTNGESKELLVESNCGNFWRNSHSTIAETEKHPFLMQLLDGSLDKAPFVDYVLQDALYLVDFAKALRILASKAENKAQAIALEGFADGAEHAEKSLHDSFFKKWNIDDSTTSQKPYTLLYTAFMLRVVALEPFAAGLAVLLPCFWVYGHIGALLYNSRDTSSRPPEYDEWIAMYGGDEFLDAVRRYRALVEHHARTASTDLRDTMRAHFERSTILEFMFWKAPLDPLIDWPRF